MKTPHELSCLLGKCPAIGSWWRHYKGNLYTIVSGAINEATLEPMVVYRGFGSSVVFTRPLSEWSGMVKGNDGKEVRRFEFHTMMA